ncbi:serine/threonine-protein kinase, partial [Mycobacterium alsense]|uniref:serine/threonine-protein kinase n=1 Tax=Mycobacterium alsense TaxID=324058 RepID=UPI0010424A7F
MSMEPGQVFAGYTILRVLGSGGMGRVYLAAHPRLPREDALKVLPADVTADPRFRERFEREAELAAGLSHPHIVGIHDRGEDEGRFWISMEYVPGTDVARLVRERFPGGLPVAEAIAIVTAVASALDYAHHRAVLHRDVKPSNILVTEPDAQPRRAYLADFGVARRVDDGGGPTSAAMAVGTAAYAAPEQLMAGRVDGRADQYALACTAFHLLAGVPPYRGESLAVVIGQHVSAPPPSIGAHRPGRRAGAPATSRAGPARSGRARVRDARRGAGSVAGRTRRSCRTGRQAPWPSRWRRPGPARPAPAGARRSTAAARSHAGRSPPRGFHRG